jgi:hypothetical protein
MTILGRTFTDADPSESESYSFDFYRDVNATDFVVSASFSLALISGVDASPSSHLSGGATISANGFDGRNTVCAQRIAGMVAGCRYRLDCQATTSQGNTPVLSGYVNCRART